jgi:hypothetical protein
MKSLPSSTKMLVLPVFTGYSEDGRDNFLFHISSIKFTSGLIGNTFGVIFNTPGVFFNKARFSANKAALLTNKLTFPDLG